VTDEEFITSMLPHLERLATQYNIGATNHFLRMAMMSEHKLGPTGDFPKGKLDATDEGGLNIAITTYRKTVRVDFFKPTAWFALPPEEALAFASLIVKHAMDIKGHR
jgi:hypothetical protein